MKHGYSREDRERARTPGAKKLRRCDLCGDPLPSGVADLVGARWTLSPPSGPSLNVCDACAEVVKTALGRAASGVAAAPATAWATVRL